MTQHELWTGILGISSAIVELTEKYFNNLIIGDSVSIEYQKDIIRALTIYSQVLNYYFLGMERGSNSIKEIDVDFILGESSRLITVFKDSYYV